MKTRVSATFLIVFLAINHTFAPASQNAPADSVAQKPAVFTEPDRAEKVRATTAAVEKTFKEYLESRHMPGFVYGVVLDGRLIYSGSSGYANLEQQIPANTKSLLRIASMSKSFTALAILQLRDAGKLNLDDPVSNTTDAPAITIRHLLTHGAGFPEDNPWGDRQLADSDKELMQFIEMGIRRCTKRESCAWLWLG